MKEICCMAVGSSWGKTNGQTLILNDNNGLISKHRNIRACEFQKKHLVRLTPNPVLNNSYIHTGTGIAIDAEHERFMHRKVVQASCKKETRLLKV